MPKGSPTPEQFRVQTVKILQKCGRTFVGRMQKEHLTGPTGPTRLAVRTGQLRRSVTHLVTPLKNGARLSVFVGGGVPYAGIHEFGGVVTPKKSKYLAIPVGKSLTKAGVSKGGPRDSGDLLMYLLNKASGKKMLVAAEEVKAKKGHSYKRPKLSGGKLDVRFVLVDKVKIKARMNFRKTFKQETQKCIKDLQKKGRVIRVKK